LDTFRLCLAFGPAAIYLVLLGVINLARRPLLVSGGRDAAALGLAISGFVIVGPIELFFPYDASIYFGSFVWVLLLGLYALGVLLVLLLLRPRLVIYNLSIEQLRPILAELVERLDPAARWAGESLSLPALGVQLHLEWLPTMRNVSLVSSGPNQSHAGWRRLEEALAAALAEQEPTGRNPRGASLLSAGCLLAVALGLAIARDPDAVVEPLQAIGRSVLELLNGR